MSGVRKFEFDLSFDAAAAVVERDVVATAEPPPPSFSLAELEAARQQAWMEGHLAGESQAAAGIERRLAEAVDRLSGVFREAAADRREAIEALERQAGEAALLLVRKLLPALVARSGTAELEALLADAFHHAVEEPRITLRCTAELAGGLEAVARLAAARSGFEGRIQMIGDPGMQDQDCRVEWAEGGVERSPRRMIEAVEAAIARGLADYDRRHALVALDGPGLEESAA